MDAAATSWRCDRGTPAGFSRRTAAEIDAPAYDRVVVGTPVRAGLPMPVASAAVQALQGAGGKSAVHFATCGAAPGETLPVLRATLAA